MSNNIPDQHPPSPPPKAFDACMAAMEDAVARAAASGTSASFALLDIDFFGKLNEKHGAEACDFLLRVLHDTLTRRFSGLGTVFRYGGDAFAVVLEGMGKESTFLEIEQTRQALDGKHLAGTPDRQVELPLSVSAGVASYPDDGEAAADITRKAGEALYRAKAGGRNKVCLAREEKMVTKTCHYAQGQLDGLARLASRLGDSEASLLREALRDLLRKHNA
jgi:diguanylate cyclase